MENSEEEGTSIEDAGFYLVNWLINKFVTRKENKDMSQDTTPAENESFFGSGGLFALGILAALSAIFLLATACVCMFIRKKDIRAGVRAGVTGGIGRYNEKHVEGKVEGGIAMTHIQPVIPAYYNNPVQNNPFIIPHQYISNEITSAPVHSLPAPIHTNPFKQYQKSRLEE